MTGYASLIAQHATLAAEGDPAETIFGITFGAGLLGIMAVLAVLFIAALVSVLGSPLTGGMKLVWIVIAFVAPVLGSLAWFVFGRRDAYSRKPVYAS